MGMDNNMATEPDEFALMIRSCMNVAAALGTKERIVSQAEYDQRLKMRRSVIAAKDLPVGHVITAEDLDAKRPGTAIPADKKDTLIGKKLVRAVEADTLFSESDFE